MTGHGLPLPADTQLQVLHIVQEAAVQRASTLTRRASGRGAAAAAVALEVRDDGLGSTAGGAPDETHVGRRIMVERAERIGAQLETFGARARHWWC